MIETTTKGHDNLISLFGDEARLGSLADVAEQDTAAYFLTDSHGYRYVLAHLLPEGNFLSFHDAYEQLPGASDIPVQLGHIGSRRHQLPSDPRTTEQFIGAGSNYRTVRIRCCELDRQDNRATWSFALQADEAVSGRLDDTLTDVDTSAEIWTELLRNLIGWEEDVADDRGKEQLDAMLRATFEVDPVEDGIQHPAEEIIADALGSNKDQRVLEWLKALCMDASQPSYAASVLRCLGRHDHVGTSSWRVGLLRDGLAADSVEIRDAAVQAAESWADSDFIEVLRSHTEPESWLQQYIFDVVDDLSE